ncbi:MAG: ACP S-malonyltransferase [Merdibacter sp.]
MMAYCKENKIKCMKLPVNGAFHSPHMQQAAQNIYEEIAGMDFAAPQFTLYANRTGKPYGPADMKTVMAEQTAHPVLFEQSVRSMLEAGADTFAEVGPGKTLRALCHASARKRRHTTSMILNLTKKRWTR